MARDVRDAALLLDAQAGLDPRDPLSFDAPEEPFAAAVERPVPPRRVAFTADLGGITPVDAEVAAICRAATRRFAELGAEVVEACPDLSAATEAFTILRAEFSSWPDAARCWSGTATASSPRWSGTSSGASA